MNERLNIRRMQVPEKSEQKFFNAECFTDLDWETMLYVLEDWYRQGKLHDYVMLARNLRIIDPSKMPQLTDQRWDNVKHFLSRSRTDREWWDLVQSDNNLRVDMHHLGLTKPPEEAEDLESSIAIWRERNTWEYVVKYAAWMRVLNGKRITFSQAEWKSISTEFDRYRQRTDASIWIAADMAASMKILEADEVKITDKGLEIISRQTVDDNTKSIPESRAI
jgi:formylmethanofuran dehydrogenase subunit D